MPRLSVDEPRITSTIAGIGGAAIGAYVLCGWIWEIEAFKGVYGPITMKANMAIGLLLCGAALAVLRWLPGVSAALVTTAAVIAALTLSEHITGWDLGIDQLFFVEPPGAAATTSPNRFGPNGAVSLLLVSFAIWQLSRGDAAGARRAQLCSIVALVLAAVPLAGYLYGAEELYGIAQYTGIALHTALTFVVLNVGVLTARPDYGPAAIFLSNGPAGTVMRSLVVPIVTIPLALGYLGVFARNSQLVDLGMGTALYAISLIVLFSIIVWQTAQAIERSDRAKRAAEHERDLLIVKEQQARADAERSNHLKDNFLATLSHELRTPLNVMLGWAQILERDTHPHDRARIAGLVARNGRLLARLVEDLLDISRAATGHFDIARTPLVVNSVVEAVVEAIRPIAEQKGVMLAAELDAGIPAIDADAERLQQIVSNLLSNAVKFTRSGGRIGVRTASDADHVTLSVSDTGVGFDEAFASELFQPFRQADSSARREHGGLGLGLSIARHLAELHGGSLVGSSPGTGQGATFTLRLPRSYAALPVAVRQEAETTYVS